MAVRYILCPVVTQIDGDGSMVTAPKVHFLIDPARGKPYEHSSAFATASWAISCVRGVDFSTITADPDCVDLFGEGVPNGGILAFLTQTPRGRGWNNAKMTQITNMMKAKGIDTTGLTRDSTLEEVLNRAFQAIAVNFSARNTRVGA